MYLLQGSATLASLPRRPKRSGGPWAKLVIAFEEAYVRPYHTLWRSSYRSSTKF